MRLHAAIYTRVSAEDVTKTSTPRQERLCRAWIELQGWETTSVFEDIARSAYQPGVVRESFESLMTAIHNQRVDAVVVWRLDRLVRSPGEYERVLAACQEAGVLIRSVSEPVDSVDPMGIAVGRIFAVFAGLESDVKSARLRSRALERAQAGLPPQHGVFGLSEDCSGIVEHEAALIREGVERVLLGEPIRFIAVDFAERGLTRRDGKPFRYDGLKKLLSNPSICGDRQFQGAVVAEGCWPAIVDRLTAATVRNQLATGKRASYKRPLNHLLGGMVTCGRCGGRMIPAHTSANRDRRYKCVHPLQCQQISISMDHLEQWVTDQVFARLEARRPGGGRKPWDQRSANLAIRALNRETDVLKALNRAHFVNAEITYTEWVRLRDEIALTTAQEVARIGPARPAGLSSTIPVWKARAHWDQLSMQVRHNVIAVELHEVVIFPTIQRKWHPDRAVPVWLLPDPKGWSLGPPPIYKVSNGYGTWDRRPAPPAEPLAPRKYPPLPQDDPSWSPATASTAGSSG